MCRISRPEAGELEQGDPGFYLPDQIEGLESSVEWQLGGLHERAGGERGLMAAGAALIALEPPAVNEPMHVAIAAWTAEPIGPARLLKSCLTLLLCAVEPKELRQGEVFLGLDAAPRHEPTGIVFPVDAI